MKGINCWLGWMGLILLCLLAFKGRGVFGSSGLQGSGNSKSETRAASAFDSIRVNGMADVEASISDQTEVIVTADDNILPLIETSVNNGTLLISEKQNISPKTRIKVTVKTPSLKHVAVSGAGDIDVKGLKENSFTVNVSGAGDVSATGEVDSLAVQLSGAGDVKLADLAAKDATVTVSGAGDAKINSTDTLNVCVSGVGSVTYKGSPKLTERVSGVGSITRIP